MYRGTGYNEERNYLLFFLTAIFHPRFFLIESQKMRAPCIPSSKVSASLVQTENVVHVFPIGCRGQGSKLILASFCLEK